ncbi:TPA: DNA polymerase [Escherichia coli]|uniref:DNA polymerase n=1 Tax=Escherichia coli TaxID=562 RepID=UPI002151A0D8|nr:DNA polymerase [Escherichia coli]MCR6144674.1 DNA polymerase [Escherichia coli]MCU6248407.1 DNA polymerase [Escherichia coli]MCU6294195.1 DNA polymerase [Escherichia coli]MCU6373196.1 DNA polymerase [Escherichia coli]MCU6380201.1 DNA polymerase [Escherichia coli]
MSNNLQDILAAASGYQSVTSEPALNRKRPKTLDDYPVIPPASKKVSVISSDLTLHIGFDTEYVFNPETQQNDILSYQSYVVLPDNTGISNIIYPPDSQKKSRLSFKDFLCQTITPLLETGVITKWPGIINIYAHFIRADIASFANFWSDYKILLKGIRGTVSSFKNRYGIDFDEQQERRVKTEQIMFDKRTSPPRCSNVAFIDTLLITPGGMGLAECGELLGLPKLTIPAPYSITNMREYLLGDRAGFEAYALRDAEIAVRYALQVRNFCARELMIDRVPATIGAMAVSRFTKTLKENNMSPEVCLGTHIKTRELWLTEKQAFRTIKNPASVPSRELFETFPINCYHGGRNECFMMGVTPSDHWYDYDLAGAYTTGLLDILTPDYGNIRLSKNPDDYCGHVMGFALVTFRFPESVPYPSLPVRTDQYGLFFPLSGESWATAPEIELALSLGAEMTIHNGIIVPWICDTSPHNSESTSVFLPFVQQVRENRNRHIKGSLEEKFWKEIGNSLYGKLAQGLRAKTAFDTARGLNRSLPPSSVTQPFFAAHVTGFIRAVVGELMNALPSDSSVVSVTTDGFLTNCPLNKINMSGPLSSRFQSLCDIVDPGSSMLTCKHEVSQLIAMKTRGQLTYRAIQGKPVVHARAGVKPPADIPRSDYNDYMVDLYLNRLPGQTLSRSTLISTREMWLSESDLVSREQDIRLNLEFDFKRQPVQPAMNEGHLLMSSRPWDNMEEALQQRSLFDDWRQTHTLKTLADWDDWCDFLYCRTVFSDMKLKVGSKRSDDILVRLFLRALTQCQWGLMLKDKKSYSCKEVAEWLTSEGYSVTVTDVKNAVRAKIPQMKFSSVTPRMKSLMDIIARKYPTFCLPV